MQNSNIVDFAVATSISMRYFQGLNVDHRVQQFEEMKGACLVLLQLVGKPPFMKSVFALWVTITSFLAVLERTLFPNQPQETPTHLGLPQHWRPLSAVLDPNFEPHTDLIDLALQNIGTFAIGFVPTMIFISTRRH